jgi:RNA polymerase sigma-70 factor (ECF subfamily)
MSSIGVPARSSEDRDPLVLVAWEGCSSEQVSEVLLIPPGTVRSRLNRIRAMLRADERAS